MVEIIETNDETEQPNLDPLKVYVKDLSFEMPTVLQIDPDDLRSEVNVDFNVTSRDMTEKDTDELMLRE